MTQPKTSSDSPEGETTNRTPMPTPAPNVAAASKPKVDAPPAGTGIRFGLGSLSRSGATAAPAPEAAEGTAFMDMNALMGQGEATEFVDMKDLIVAEEARPTLPKGPLAVMGGLIAVVGIVLAVLVATKKPDIPPKQLPPILLERGESLITAFPPYDTYTLSDPLVVTESEQGNGLMKLAGMTPGTCLIHFEKTEGGNLVRSVVKIEVVAGLDQVICNDIRTELKDQPPTAKLNKAKDFIGRAKGYYGTRAQHTPNLFFAYLNAQKAVCLLDQLDTKSAAYIEAKDMMDKAKIELDGTFRETRNKIQQFIQIREWKAVKQQIDYVLGLLPDQRDPRHQYAQRVKDQFFEFLPKD